MEASWRGAHGLPSRLGRAGIRREWTEDDKRIIRQLIDMGFKVTVTGGITVELLPFFQDLDVSIIIAGRAIHPRGSIHRWPGSQSYSLGSERDGVVVDDSLKPSVDTATHLYIYQHRQDMFGIGHTHSLFATSFAALGQPIPTCLTTTAMLGGEIPLGAYVPIGGEAIGREIVDKIGNSLTIVMQNHGVFTIGSSPWIATKMAVEVDEIAEITHLALLRGQPIMLNEDQIAEVARLYRYDYGQ